MANHYLQMYAKINGEDVHEDSAINTAPRIMFRDNFDVLIILTYIPSNYFTFLDFNHDPLIGCYQTAQLKHKRNYFRINFLKSLISENFNATVHPINNKRCL